MQVFVVRSELATESVSQPVHVIAEYSNDVIIDIAAHGSVGTRLLLADGFTVFDATSGIKTLKDGWRTDYKPVLNGEASRRIALVFPDYKQRNYTAHYQDNITQYGVDTTTWPQVEKDFKNEYDRGWAYVNDVRAAANSFNSMPPDPTADGNWPPTITPIQ